MTTPQTPEEIERQKMIFEALSRFADEIDAALQRLNKALGKK